MNQNQLNNLSYKKLIQLKDDAEEDKVNAERKAANSTSILVSNRYRLTAKGSQGFVNTINKLLEKYDL